MIIEELYIGGFGRWRETAFTFAPGLNLFVAPNEAGKTTLLHALFAALYGMKRDYLRATRYLDEYDRYYPWHPAPYETVIRYQLAGQGFRLHRCHDKEREQARLFREPELTEITHLYQEDRRKEYNFLERHLGLTRTLFLNVTWVRREPVQAARQLLPSMVRDSAADPLVHSLMAALEQELNSVGRKESAAQTVLGRLTRQLEQAERELARAEADWRAVQELSRSLADWQVKRNMLEAERKRIEADLERLSRAEADWQTDWQRSFAVTAAAELAAWAESAATEAERELHRQTAEELRQMEQEMAELREWSAEESKDGQSETAEHYLSFAGIAEAAWQQWLQDWYALSVYEKRQPGSAPLVDVNKLQADFRVGQEWAKEAERLQRECERLAAQIAETERTRQAAGVPSLAPAPLPEQERRTLASRTQRAAVNGKRRAARSTWGWYAAAVLAAGLGVWFGWSGQEIAAALLAVLAAAAVWAGQYVGRDGRRAPVAGAPTAAQTAELLQVANRLQARLAELQGELAAKQEERDKLQAALGKLLAEWDVPDWEAFLAMREKWLIQIHAHQAGEKEARERERLRMRLEKQMLEWGVPPHLPFEEAAALVLREHAEWEQRSRAEQERLRAALDRQKERARAAQRLEQLERQRAELLEKWGSAVREMLLRRKQELEQKRQQAEAARAQREEAIAALREQIAHARGEIGQRGEVAWAKAKSFYDDVKEKWEDARLRRDALCLAQTALQEAVEEWRSDIAPRLSQTASSVSRRLTKGRYEDVRVDPLQNFAVRVVEPQRRDIIEHDRFSSGTQDQLYFAQRIALLKTVSAGREPLPIFLDDHFLHYDQERLAAALDYLIELAEVHQVFLFSCHWREHDYLKPVISGTNRHKLHEWPGEAG